MREVRFLPGPGRRRRTVGRKIAVVMVLVVGAVVTMGASVPAARSDGASLRAWVQVQFVGAPRTLCVGDTFAFRATVWKGTATWGSMSAATGATISATAASGAGTISPSSGVSSLRSMPPSAVTFIYTAVAPGTDIVEVLGTVDAAQFLGLEMGGTTVRRQFRLEVVDCEYRISVTSKWRVPGEAHLAIVAKIELAGISADPDDRWSGTARVQWSVTLGQVGDCNGTLSPESQARVVGVRGRRGTITWDVEYDAATAQIAIDCGKAGKTMKVTMLPVPLTFGLAAEGGAKTEPHILAKPGGDTGTATISVSPVRK